MPNIPDKIEEKHLQALRGLPRDFLEYIDYMEYQTLKNGRRAEGEERAVMAGRAFTWDELRTAILKAKGDK